MQRVWSNWRTVSIGDDVVDLEQVPCHFGGERPYFLCPDCGRRCLHLYRPADDWHFACRTCLDLAYAVECEPKALAWKRRKRKLAARLGTERSRPVGMHWRTFWRLLDELDAIDGKFNALLMGAYRELVRRP